MEKEKCYLEKDEIRELFRMKSLLQNEVWNFHNLLEGIKWTRRKTVFDAISKEVEKDQEESSSENESCEIYLTAVQAGKALNCSDNTIVKMLNDGSLEALPRFERCRYRIPISEVERVKKSMEAN